MEATTHSAGGGDDGFTDALLEAEEAPRRAAWEEGQRDGATIGFCDGFAVGLREGGRVGDELGYYAGVAAVAARLAGAAAGAAAADSREVAGGDSRLRAVAEQLARAAAEQPCDDVRGGDLPGALQQLRAKFKLLRSLSHMRLPTYGAGLGASTASRSAAAGGGESF